MIRKTAMWIFGRFWSVCLAKCLALILCSVLTVPATAQDTNDTEGPYACPGRAEGLTLAQMRDLVRKRVAAHYTDALDNCITADLMRRIGDGRTAGYFELAIGEDPHEPAYELFYADYLRNFRGPNRPLFPQAEKHYFLALKVLANRKPPLSNLDEITKSRIERGLIALYQEDGITILSRQSGATTEKAGQEIPLAFFSSINRYAQSTADLDREVDDIRDYTSEALFSASNFRNGHPLDITGLRTLLRIKTPFETVDRVRFRYGNLPSIDIFGGYQHTPNDAVNDFFTPNVFNGLVLYDYGISAEKPFSIAKNLDADIVGTFKEIRQRGLLEFGANIVETIQDYEIKAAVSKFIGPDKIILQFNYAYQAIQAVTRADRDREFTGATLTYQLLRPHGFKSSYDRRFEVRSWDFFGGFLIDNEAFNDKTPANNVTDIRRDYFAGIALKGIERFDLTIQPTIFSLSSSNPDRAPASNSQYRTNLTLLYRIVDEECTPGLPEQTPATKVARNHCRPNAIERFARRPHPLNIAFWQLVLPFRQDIAYHNLSAFENYKIGMESDWKFFIIPRRTTFLASVGYDFQRFYRLNKNENNFRVSMTMGF